MQRMGNRINGQNKWPSSNGNKRDIREEMVKHIPNKCTEINVEYLEEVHRGALALSNIYK